MRFIIQRVKEAQVVSEGAVLGKIDKGFLVLIGISEADTEEIADKMVKKLLKMRIFEDDNGKTNLDIDTVSGSLLLISQFTLYADCKKGNRPSFVNAARPDRAERLYDYVVSACKQEMPDRVEKGKFGAYMEVSLLNDGPFTIILDSDDL
jgi:D-tyrosyl-tRNA(Tyr) deacylase